LSKSYHNQDVFFAYLDILGFKNLVLNNENEYLSNLYTEIIDKIVLKGITIGKSKYVGDDPKFAVINSLVVSDSIMLWTNHSNIWGLLEITEATRHILSGAIESGIPLRGIITKGPIIFQKKEEKNNNFDNGRITLAGKALVRAYTEEETFDWSGCVISDECVEIWETGVIKYYLDDARKNNVYVKYPVPVKFKDSKGNIHIEKKVKTVFNWVNDTSKEMTKEDVEAAFSAHKKGTDQKKLQHTLEFYTEMKK
jgi:hypothetical protein